MNEWKEKCAWRTPAARVMVLCTLAMAASASGEVNVERLNDAGVTRLIVHAGDGAVTRGTVATAPLGSAVVYHAEPTDYISGCWPSRCGFGFADEMRLANFPHGGGELTSYTFSYAAGYAWHFGSCVPPYGSPCDCYCPAGGGCDEGDPPYTVTAALYDGPPSPNGSGCGNGLPIPGTEVQFQTTASRPLGDRRIEVTVDLAPKAFVPSVVWGVVTVDIEDAWMIVGTSPTVGSSPGSGARWIDSDSDGCWDEWECWEGPYGFGWCPGCDWATFHAEANAQIVMRWQPVLPPASTKHSATATYRVRGNEALLQQGGEPVWLEIRVSDFDPKQTEVLLRAWQAGVDAAAGYASGLQGTLAPHFADCTGGDICAEQMGPGSVCPFPPTNCPAGHIDKGRADYIFFGQLQLNAVDVSTLNYRYASMLMGAPVVSPGTDSYLGTLVLYVPDDAKGTFEIGFLAPPDSALLDGYGQFIPLLGFVPGKITVEEWAVPAVSAWGVVIIALLVAVFGKAYFGRRPVSRA